MTDFQDIQHNASRLVSDHAKRDSMLEEMRRMFHMEWSEAPNSDWIKETMSPSAYNAAIGAVRLLTTTEPHFSVAYEQSDREAKRRSEGLEKAAKAMWASAGRVTGIPVEQDVALSAILSGEVCIAVTKMEDLVALAKKSKNKAHVRRMEAVRNDTPYLFKVYPASICYPDFDSFGTRAVLRKVKSNWGEVIDTWGDMVENAEGRNRRDAVVLYDWYDWDCRCVWVEGGSKPIYHEDLDLDFLPIVCQITDGSLMFDRPDLQRLPFLFGMWKSGLWKRENLSLTTIYSLVFALGSNPLLKRRTSDPGSPLQINRTIPGGFVDLNLDEELSPLAEKVLDSSLLEGLRLSQGIGEESTISKQALGSPPSGAMAYSAISLLAQSGRLPLTGPRSRGGRAIAQAVVMALKWMKADGGKGELYGRDGNVMELVAEEIPERIAMQCILEPDLPQDKLQMAQVGQSLIASGLASKRWVQENILQIGQSSDMDKEIWMEKRLELEIGSRLAAIQQQIQAALRQKAGGGMQGGMGAGGGMGEMSAGEGPYPPGGEVGPGAPLSGPLPAKGMPGA